MAIESAAEALDVEKTSVPVTKQANTEIRVRITELLKRRPQ